MSAVPAEILPPFAPESEQEFISPPLHAVEEVLTEIANAPRIPKALKGRNVKDQIRAAFELVGGVPRMATWAHHNYGDFMKIYARMVPTQVTGENGGPLQVVIGANFPGRDLSGKSFVVEPPSTPEQS